MKNWKLTCTDGYTKVVSAASQDEAVVALMADAEVQAHVASNHPEMAGKAPEDMKQVVMSMVTEEMAAPAADMGGTMPPTGGDMGGGTPPAAGAV